MGRYFKESQRVTAEDEAMLAERRDQEEALRYGAPARLIRCGAVPAIQASMRHAEATFRRATPDERESLNTCLIALVSRIDHSLQTGLAPKVPGQVTDVARKRLLADTVVRYGGFMTEWCDMEPGQVHRTMYVELLALALGDGSI